MPETDVSAGLSTAAAGAILRGAGYNEVPGEKVNLVRMFMTKFWGLSAWMLEFIILLSFFLHRYSDVYIVSGLLVFNAVIGFMQEHNAAKAVDALKSRLQVMVKLLRDSSWSVAPARNLVPGDIIRIRLGDFVPADIKIITGKITVNQSALTGESAELEKLDGDDVYSGSVVTGGEATAIVTLTGNRTYFGKTVQLVKTARPKSHINDVVSAVVKKLLLFVVILLVLATVVLFLRGGNILEMLPLMLVILLGAIPVALTAMFTVSMAVGSKELVRRGVLVTRLTAPEDAAGMDVLCIDKTGTLTLNKLSVAELLPAAGFTGENVLQYGALASQEANNDAIDIAFINAARQKGLLNNNYRQETFTPFDPQTRKTTASIKAGSDAFTVMKGSFSAIAHACHLNEQSATGWENQVTAMALRGYRSIAVGVIKDGIANFAGIAALHDPPRPGSELLIGELEAMGISIKMLTGDALPIAKEIASALHLGPRILKASELNAAPGADAVNSGSPETADGFAEVYPQDKYTIVKALQARGHIVGMTGDGVNDAPALKQAEVGIAVSNASDVAKGAASIVLTAEGLAGIKAPVLVGRMMFERINIWVLNKMARTVSKSSFVIFAYLILGKFVITASAMLVMIFMTDFVKISLAADHVNGPVKPAVWNINQLAKTALIIGILMTIESFLLLYAGIYYFQLGANISSLNTFCFEILLFSALFSLFVVRSKKHFWSRPGPSPVLLLLILLDIACGAAFASFGWLGFKAIPLQQTLFVLAGTAIFGLLINDYIKFRILKNASLSY